MNVEVEVRSSLPKTVLKIFTVPLKHTLLVTVATSFCLFSTWIFVCSHCMDNSETLVSLVLVVPCRFCLCDTFILLSNRLTNGLFICLC